MSDIGDAFEGLKLQRQAEGGNNRATAARQFPGAAAIAAGHGMALLQHSDTHYQLRHPDGWLLNIYPGNRRLFHDMQRKGPYLKVPADWGLLDVVEAAVKATNKEAVTR